MIDIAIFLIRKFGDALGMFLRLPVPLSDGSDVRLYDVFVFFFLIFAFIKFLGVVTHNQTLTRRG